MGLQPAAQGPQPPRHSGKVEVNGLRAKPKRLIRAGDTLEVSRPQGRKQLIIIRGVAQRHVARAEARTRYEDTTPPPTAQEIEVRRMERIYKAAMTPPRTPDKRARRALRDLKHRQR